MGGKTKHMRILAVIPARAGSKGIPNKNIRLLADKPLIYYSIKNALDSKFITDVVVTTDSKAVELLCNQMNVRVKERDKSLCGDEVTLDSVVYDACNRDTADYVVTMQPTSPTLKVETLDSAIAYALERDLDTVISVINRPHLSWKEQDGKKVPNYEKRCNRQFLPANYVETGAFVISKKEIVTIDSRIGENVDVFELSEEEAIDIDSFSDFQIAEGYLRQHQLAFWVNGNNKIGMGHIFRVLELADEFYCKPDIYYDINETELQVFGKTAHNLIGVSGEEGLLDAVSKKKYYLIINDVLDTTKEFIKSLKTASGARIINFEDDGDGSRYADLVFNALYEKSDMTNVRCGESYYIVPRNYLLFQPIVIRDKVKTVFICFGGADPMNYTDRILKLISKEKYNGYQFIVVLGRAKNNVSELLEYNKRKNIQVLYDVENMPEIMAKCDMAVTSRGRTGYELAVLGIPTIAMSQNKREELHRFICEENGYIYLGMNPTDYVIASNLDMLLYMSQTERRKLQNQLLQFDLKGGRKRVMGLINGL